MSPSSIVRDDTRSPSYSSLAPSHASAVPASRAHLPDTTPRHVTDGSTTSSVALSHSSPGPSSASPSSESTRSQLVAVIRVGPSPGPPDWMTSLSEINARAPRRTREEAPAQSQGRTSTSILTSPPNPAMTAATSHREQHKRLVRFYATKQSHSFNVATSKDGIQQAQTRSRGERSRNLRKVKSWKHQRTRCSAETPASSIFVRLLMQEAICSWHVLIDRAACFNAIRNSIAMITANIVLRSLQARAER